MTDAPTATGRRGFMVGAAGLAAGAALLGGASPAGASHVESEDLDVFWIDDPNIYPVDFGDGGFARADFIAEGDIAVMTMRMVVGADADLGTNFWAIDGATLPSGYQPAAPTVDPEIGIGYGWLGNGVVVDLTKTTQDSFQLTPYWGNYSAVNPTAPDAALVFGVVGNPGQATNLNTFGTDPFGSAMAEGTTLFASLTYRREVPT